VWGWRVHAGSPCPLCTLDGRRSLGRSEKLRLTLHSTAHVTCKAFCCACFWLHLPCHNCARLVTASYASLLRADIRLSRRRPSVTFGSPKSTQTRFFFDMNVVESECELGIHSASIRRRHLFRRTYPQCPPLLLATSCFSSCGSCTKCLDHLDRACASPQPTTSIQSTSVCTYTSADPQ